MTSNSVPTPAPYLDIRDLTITLQDSGRQLVSSASLSVDSNEIVGLVGSSGSGKTLIATATAGLLLPPLNASGTISLDGRNVVEQGEAERRYRAQRIGMIFQNPTSALNPRLTLGAQLRESLPASARGKRNAELAHAAELLDAVGIQQAQSRVNSYPHEISGGQAQRVVIALALARQPKLLIADEPTTALDVTVQAQILDLLAELQQEHHFGVLLITHDMGIVHDYAHRITVIDDGAIVESGNTVSVFDNPQTEVARHLVSIARRYGELPVARPLEADATPLVTIRGLTKTFGKGHSEVHALAGVDIDVAAGSSLGIVGESGSGKTTVARILAGLETPTAGEITFAGKPRPTAKRLDQIQYVFQDPYSSLNPRLHVVDIVAEPLRAHGLNKRDARERARDLLKEVRLFTHLHHSKPHQLSGGQRQRVGIARALALNPAVLITDEPVAALDSAARDRILTLLEDLHAHNDVTHVVISHDLGVVARLCEDIIVMQRGHIVERGKTREVFTNPQHPYTQELLDSLPGHGRNQLVAPPSLETPLERTLA